MAENRVSIKIGGEAGYGIMTAGGALGKAFARGGLNVHTYSEFPSLIRGGHNTYQICAAPETVYAHWDKIQVLLALNEETIALHWQELTPGGAIIYDSKKVQLKPDLVKRSDVHIAGVPLEELAEKAGGKIMMNTVSLGAALSMVDFPFDYLESALRDQFAKKKEIGDQNVAAAKAGYDFITASFAQLRPAHVKPVPGAPRRILIAGNDATAVGALRAGVKFHAQYPMTPASSILHLMAAQEKNYDIVAKQVEDEIAAINFAIGANFAGGRAMAATSGGGFSLMVEALGMAGMCEVPLVIIEVMRPGPSTGMPTWTDQGDLQFVIHASQGEFPRVIIAPGDQEELFYETFNAFNFAERFQLPVIVLSDKYIAEGMRTFEPFRWQDLKVNRGKLIDEAQAQELFKKDGGDWFKRFRFTEDGVSPRSLPGMRGGMFVAATDEHDETGEIVESAENRTQMMSKRMHKLDEIAKEIPGPKFYGPKDADLTLVCFGSSKMPVLETFKDFERNQMKVNMLHFVYMHPFPTADASAKLKSCKKWAVLEANFNGQFEALVAEKTGMRPSHSFRRWDGRPFSPEWLFSKVEEVL
jgi:2-oxoglutarate ferredoxin oxidoreductase subunit alpha